MSKWSPEETFDDRISEQNINESPRPAFGMGPMLGLTISMNVDREEHYCSFAVCYGWKVMIHTPNEYPYMSAHGESVATRMETDMIITPKIVTATKYVKEIKTKNRKCYFQEENFLTFYAYVRHVVVILCVHFCIQFLLIN